MSMDAMKQILRKGRAPGMGNRSVILRKRNCRRGPDGPHHREDAYIVFAVVNPGTPETRKLLPAEYRGQQHIVIYTEESVSAGGGEICRVSLLPDLVEVDGRCWRVVRAWENREPAFYRALAVPDKTAPCFRPGKA